MTHLKDDVSSQSDYIKLENVNYNDDSRIVDQTLYRIVEEKMLITKKRNFTFYFKITTVSILNSLYYCVILSLNREIELVAAKMIHSIIIFILTMIEHIIVFQNKHERQGKDNISFSSFTDKKYLLAKEKDSKGDTTDKSKHNLKSNKYEELDNKEMYFYDFIYGMLSFTSELLLYYFLSLSVSFELNIGSLYSLMGIEYILLIIRLPYFGIIFKSYQILGFILNCLLVIILFYSFIPKNSIFITLMTSLTVSLFKFIKFCIFEYVHENTNNAKKLVREGIYVDGLIGLMLLIFVITSGHFGIMITDTSIFMKVIIASFFYYFALKITLQKEKHFYLYVIYSSFNFVFISIFDYILNGRAISFFELLLVALLSASSIIGFVQFKL